MSDKEIRLIRSFGRIKSRSLSQNKQDLFDNLLPKYAFDVSDKNFLNQDNLCLEIGFGFGDFTFEFAKKNPHINLIACETHINGIVNLLAKLNQESIANIRIFKSDVRILLKDLEDKIFDQINILFPDPWPKSKHYKRRLINADFLNILSKKIKKTGKLIIATDHESYKEWIMNLMISHDNFIWSANTPKDWEEFPDDWTYTKYQKKAQKAGRQSAYLEFFAT